MLRHLIGRFVWPFWERRTNPIMGISADMDRRRSDRCIPSIHYAAPWMSVWKKATLGSWLFLAPLFLQHRIQLLRPQHWLIFTDPRPVLCHLKVARICVPTSLSNRQSSPRLGFFFFSPDPARVLTQVPLVTVQPPADYCSEDSRGSYAPSLLCSGLSTSLSLMPSSIYLLLKTSGTEILTIPLMLCGLFLVGKGNSLCLVTPIRILLHLLSRFESISLWES